MELKPGYKRTDLGIIPCDWDVTTIGAIADVRDGTHQTPQYVSVGVPFYSVEHVTARDFSNTKFISEAEHRFLTRSFKIEKGDILMTRIGSIGDCVLVTWDVNASFYVSLALLKVHGADACYVAAYSEYRAFKQEVELHSLPSATPKKINLGAISGVRLPLPSKRQEQVAIATILQDIERFIGLLDRSIAKKRDLKQAAMQQLLTGKIRLPGFTGEWTVRTIKESAECLDNVRVPLNETQRAKMRGEFPYCGANGVLDYVNGYVIDDDIILMAEDGGYFDEYETRPIAYRMIGKCWVNNHAHILKAKAGFEQAFLYYSLVHKNILPFLASATRAKLNKFEMNRIEIRVPVDQSEQTAIGTVLSDLDAEIAALKERREKTRNLKQAMMQELLTGKTRLVSPEVSAEAINA
jgi:type I restriction enzyme, S subunit